MNTEEFNINTEFAIQLRSLGIEASELGGVQFTGSDPIFNNSVLRLGAAFAIPAMLAAAGVAAIWQSRTGRKQNLSIKLNEAAHGLNPHTTSCSTLNDVKTAAPVLIGNPFLLWPYRTADRRDVFLSAVYPHQERQWLSFLRCGPATDQVSAAVASRNSQELEDEANGRGLTCCIARTPEEWLAHPQGRLLASKPLIEVLKSGEGESVPFSGPRPLSGIRVLSLTHAIAGPTVGRTLAEHGAEVLQITDPHSYEHPAIWQDANVGHRTSLVDLKTETGLASVKALVRQTDVVVISFRPGKLDRLGLSPSELRSLNPNLVIVNVSCYGNEGPWKNRGGFDMLGSAASGLTMIEGGGGPARLPGLGLLNDFVTGYLGAAGATAALLRRSREGGTYTVNVSLTRNAMWCASLGTVGPLDKSEPHRLETPRMIEVATPLGQLRRLAPAVSLSETYPSWQTTVLEPLGSSQPRYIS